MSTVKRPLPDDFPQVDDVNWAFGTEEGIEGPDYELDEILRKLTFSQWFTTAEEDIPFFWR